MFQWLTKWFIPRQQELQKSSLEWQKAREADYSKVAPIPKEWSDGRDKPIEVTLSRDLERDR